MNSGSIPQPQGFVNLDKPRGMNSRRASDAVGRFFGRAPTGHAGTLDPLATGVLPVAVGGATRLAGLVSSSDKEYVGRVRLGVCTDSDDADGRELGPVRPVTTSRQEAEAALALFLGTVQQRPPAVSAIKRGGQAAHKLARAGADPGLEPRPATYFELELLAWEPPELELRARVSSGTYIRALARDLGERLRCGGHLAALRRTRAGSFALHDSVTLERLGELAAAGRAAEALIPAAGALPDMPRLTARDGKALYDLSRGRPVPLAAFAAAGDAPVTGTECLVLEPDGRCAFVGRLLSGTGGELLVQSAKMIK